MTPDIVVSDIQSEADVPQTVSQSMQAYAMGLDIEPDSAELRDGLQAVSDDLTGNDLREVSAASDIGLNSCCCRAKDHVPCAALCQDMTPAGPTPWRTLSCSSALDQLHSMHRTSCDLPASCSQ